MSDKIPSSQLTFFFLQPPNRHISYIWEQLSLVFLFFTNLFILPQVKKKAYQKYLAITDPINNKTVSRPSIWILKIIIVATYGQIVQNALYLIIIAYSEIM